jgi:acyl carrier protein
MQKNELLLVIDGILGQPKGTLTGAEKISSIGGWDSLAVLEFITVVDKHFGVTLSPEEMKKAETILDLLSLVN